MRRIFTLFLCVILMCFLAVTVHAANSASGVHLSATVSANGSCQVTLDLQMHLDAAVDQLYFPLPGNARSVSLNGSSARTRRNGDVLNVDLSRLLSGTVGDFPLRIQYTISNTVEYDESGKPILTLPLLSGFSCPVDSLSFTITLPQENNIKPVFTSGYYQQSIEADMSWTYSGNTVSGSVLSQLKDKETLSMKLNVVEDMFPRDPIKQWTVGIDDIAMTVLAVLAGLYWLIFLRCAPILSSRSATPPEGFTAGQLGSCLAGQGSDLTMMVFSWAQLGYVLICPDRHGRVMLHKRMEMDNERSGYEVRLFRSLFGKKNVIDGTGYHYAVLCRKASATPGDIRDLYRPSSGNTAIFRGLCCGIGLFGGISLGISLAGSAVLGILLIAVLAILGAFSAWFIQEWIRGLHLHHRFSLLVAFGASALWLIFGALAGEFHIALFSVLAQLICGLGFAYGGRRTPMGRQIAAEILGLRHYLCRVPKEDLERICLSDPDYFFSLAPCALAFGVEEQFAKRFGGKKLSPCPYLTTGSDVHMTALEWSRLMRRTITALDQRQRKLPLERLTGR